jgi:hypothetical protein
MTLVGTVQAAGSSARLAWRIAALACGRMRSRVLLAWCASSTTTTATAAASRTTAASRTSSLVGRVAASACMGMQLPMRASLSAAVRTAALVRGAGSVPPPMRGPSNLKKRNRALLFYGLALAVLSISMAYAAVPLYKMFCQATGYGGTTRKHSDKATDMSQIKPVRSRPLTIVFNADTSAALRWSFKPQQRQVWRWIGSSGLVEER